MKLLVTAALGVVLALGAAPAARAQDPLGPAKELYAAARYEEALKALDAIVAAPATPDVVLPAQQHRALCLLALERKADAERAIEAVLDLDPFYQPGEDDAAPWVRAAFREVRQRVLPGAVQQLYGRGKQAFDRKAWAEASVAFTSVMKILDDPDLSLDKGAQADMRMVVRGFLDLADAAARMAVPPAAPAVAPPAGTNDTSTAAPSVPAAADPANPQKPGAADATRVYDATSNDVVPPLPLRQNLPIPDGARPLGAPKEGSVEIIVGVNGSVETAVLRQPLGPTYDPLVLQAAANWRYRPAMKGGTPVRYRRLVRVVIPQR